MISYDQNKVIKYAKVRKIKVKVKNSKYKTYTFII